MTQPRLGWRLTQFACSLVAFLGIGLRIQAQAADLDARIAKLCEEASRARAASKLDLVEQKRRERWSLIQEAAGDPINDGSRWVAAYKAIRDVDGDEKVIAGKLRDAGLLNRMDYKAACERLRVALKGAQGGEGPYLGELATRFFEVAQQARSCYRDALVAGSPECVATIEELKAALADVEQRDPCCVTATPMLLFLAEPDPREAFLRAEFREDFKKRQAKLVELSHRVTFFGEDQAPKAEHADDPVLPWHAAVEIDKARSLDHLLQELDYTSYLTPNVAGAGYVLPGKVIKGRDSLSDPFVLVYGRYLVCRVVDKKGRLRAAELFLNAKGEWERRYLDLLCRLPSENKTVELTAFDRLLNNLPIREEFALAGERFAIRDFPVESCETLMSNGVPQFCVRDVAMFAKMRFSATQNNPKALESLASAHQQLISTSQPVRAAIEKFVAKGDRTQHPLVDLMNSGTFNPLIVVSDDDGAEAGPNLMQNPGGDPYVLLDDGAQLFYDLEGDDERVPCCYVNYPGATAFMPLHLHAIPLNLLEAGEMGAAFSALLQDAGYSEPEAAQELRKCIERTTYIPPRFDARWKARAKSTKKPMAEVLQAMLKEKGWSGGIYFPPEIWRLYDKYGFRYLRDRRGNWIVSGGFASDQGIVEIEGQSPQNKDELLQYPFDFRAQDGRQRVSQRQIYAWKDYETIKANIYGENLSKLIRMHPCLPVWDMVVQDSAKPLLNPEFSVTGIDPMNFEGRFSDRQKFLAKQEPMGDTLLLAPYAGWLAEDDKNLATTLTNLHNELVRRVHEAAVSSRAMELYIILYEWLGFLDEKLSRVPGAQDKLKDLRRQLDGGFNARREQWQKSTSAVFAVQLESARYFADNKLLHRAMVHYNDLLAQQHTSRYRYDGVDLFAGVASSEQAEKFAEGFRLLVEGQRLVLAAELELGGVLNAAGLSESAHALWQRIVDDHRYYVVPTVQIAEETVTSYGVRFSDRATAALRSYDALAECAEQAVAKYRLAPAWRTLIKADGPKQKDVDDAIAIVEQANRRQEAKEAVTPDQKRALDRAVSAITDGRDMNFRSWLRYRKALLPHGAIAFRSLAAIGYTLHPLQFCPASYSRDGGFDRPVAEVFARVDADSLEKWCDRADDDAFRDPLAADACFVVGWYWLDVGQRAKSRAAFVQLVDVLGQRARIAKEKVDELTDKLSALSALLGASSIVDDVPGVNVVKSDFSVFLKPQVLWWEREWFAASLYGPHASVEGRRLERQAVHLQTKLLTNNASWRSGRYFLPDYTYQYGVVPDWLSNEAMSAPELFNPELKKEAIAEKKEDAVGAGRWALLTPEHTKIFFDQLKVNPEVKQHIVELKK